MYDRMVAAFAEKRGTTATPNIEQEVMQRIALAGLYEEASFGMQPSMEVLVFGCFTICPDTLKTWTFL